MYMLRCQSKSLLFRLIVLVFTCVFLTSSMFPQAVQAQSALNLPFPGTMVSLSPEFTPTMLRGMTLNAADPFLFDFIIEEGENEKALAQETEKLVKYFLAALTTPEEDLWVNLSPFEKDRIVPESLGRSEMGRDLLAQDYLLKQLTASLMYPESELGEKFWKRIYKKIGPGLVPRDQALAAFNKVWIMPETASVYVYKNHVMVVEAELKVLLEEDYAATAEDRGSPLVRSLGHQRATSGEITSHIIKQIIIPELEHEVNHGQNFAALRQIFNAAILAKWYKENLNVGTARERSLLGHIYVDQNKTEGINDINPNASHEIYNQYLAAFKKGVYNYIKEEYDETTQEMIPRKYFSGGFDGAMRVNREKKVDLASLPENPVHRAHIKFDAAMQAESKPREISLAELGDRLAKAQRQAEPAKARGKNHEEKRSPPVKKAKTLEKKLVNAKERFKTAAKAYHKKKLAAPTDDFIENFNAAYVEFRNAKTDLEELQRQTRLKSAQHDPAMTTQTPTPDAAMNPGGIDLTPENYEINKTGEQFKFDLEFDPEFLQDIHINGLKPVIINITPISNLPLMLGLVDEDTPPDTPTGQNPLQPVDNRNNSLTEKS